jgi:transposase-like protein
MVQNSSDKVNEEVPNTEVVTKAKRRHFTAAEKIRILQEVDACQGTGEIGALLRREGIYSSYLTTWRRQRESRELEGLAPHAEERSAGKRGPKPNPEAIELAKLRREHACLQERMRQAELIIDVQKKLLGCLEQPWTRPTWTIRVDTERTQYFYHHRATSS